MDNDLIDNLGPLGPMAGNWEGDQGVDLAPTPNGPVESKFREHMVLTPFGPVKNRSQVLYGLRYSTMAWRIGDADPFHEEVGYWLWDPGEQEVRRCFFVPRGVAVIAGGQVSPDSKHFRLAAESGSSTNGVLSSRFLDASARVQRYEIAVNIHSDGSFSYTEDTVLDFLGDQFHHTDENRLYPAS